MTASCVGIFAGTGSWCKSNLAFLSVWFNYRHATFAGLLATASAYHPWDEGEFVNLIIPLCSSDVLRCYWYGHRGFQYRGHDEHGDFFVHFRVEFSEVGLLVLAKLHVNDQGCPLEREHLG